MKYMLLIHQGDTPRPDRPGETNRDAVAAFENLSEEEKGAIYAAYGEVNQTPGVTPGIQLEPAESAKTVRSGGEDGQIVTDGPYAEAKEAIAGYLVFEAGDIDAAVELAREIPAARLGGAVEVRPIAEW